MDIATLIPQFGGVLWTAAAFVVALSVIVFVHEFGHYIVGRWSGIHAEVFSIGMGPALVSRTDRHGTRWQVAALPFGGYVRFLGDASGASDKATDAYEALDEETRRHTLHGAPLWARAATLVAGPLFNFILSILLFAAVVLWQGVAKEPVEVGDLRALPTGEASLQPGDRILAVNGAGTPDLATFYEVIRDLPVAPSVDYRIDRGGRTETVAGRYPFPPLVEGLQPGSAAMDAGIEIGDLVTAIDGQPVMAFGELQDVVSNSGGRPLRLDIWRDGQVIETELAARRVDVPDADGGFETRWLIGMTGGLMFTPVTESPGLFEALRIGVDQTVFIAKSSLSGLWHMITGAISSCNLRGPLGIAETSGAAASQGLGNFVWFIAVLSTAVGLLNLFPIPVLDGGHLVFYAYEAVAGHPPSDGAMRVLMSVGLALLLTLMVFALGNDLFCP
ncbi:RIP metalloprotease RseP [Tropicimonas sp.]|uniref:RIP metalloprotease RseP n=1 Tax=Tropicimonas sp. TaxID=2067044 RepID=UPI003A8815DE